MSTRSGWPSVSVKKSKTGAVALAMPSTLAIVMRASSPFGARSFADSVSVEPGATGVKLSHPAVAPGPFVSNVTCGAASAIVGSASKASAASPPTSCLPLMGGKVRHSSRK